MKLIFFLRSLVMAVLFPVFTLLCSLLMMVASFGGRKWLNRVGHLWTSTSLAMFGVKLKTIDKQNIPPGNCLFLFNHTSFFDIFSLFTVVPVRYGAKIELFSIPFFGQAMKAFGILPIARSNRQEVFKVYEEVIKDMQPGDRFALSPEGGRNKEEKLLPFKTGPFVFAIQAKIPVVPVVIRGARDIMPKGSFIPNPWHWTREIEIRFLPPVEAASYNYETRNDLQNQVYSEMKQYFA